MLFYSIIRIVLSNWIPILCFCAAAWAFADYSKKRFKNGLPGPWGLPIVGIVPFVGRRQELTFTKWAKKYGEVVGFKVGSNYMVVLNSYDAINEAFVRNSAVFNDRPDNYIYTEALHKKGIGSENYSPEYMLTRKFCHDALGRLGFGKIAMETLILNEVDNLIRQLGDGEVLVDEQTKERILIATGNIVFQVTAGKRYDDHRDPEFRDILTGATSFLNDGSLELTAVLAFPVLARFPMIRKKASQMTKSLDKICEIVSKKIKQHQESVSESSSRDFIDEYLSEIKRTGDKSLYSEELLTNIVRDFFVGGLETVQLTMIFSFLLLANRPFIMKKVHDEIDEVLGSDETPRYSLRENLPFCSAVIKEIMRFRTVTPLLAPHSTPENVNFRGYIIPKGATVLANAYAVHNDHRNWEKPEEFIPERHIDVNRKLNASKYLIPFGLGPRSCPGRRLAEMEVFIMFVRIFQRYDVAPTPTPQCQRPHVEDDVQYTGLSVFPPHHTPVTLIPR